MTLYPIQYRSERRNFRLLGDHSCRLESASRPQWRPLGQKISRAARPRDRATAQLATARQSHGICNRANRAAVSRRHRGESFELSTGWHRGCARLRLVESGKERGRFTA